MVIGSRCYTLVEVLLAFALLGTVFDLTAPCTAQVVDLERKMKTLNFAILALVLLSAIIRAPLQADEMGRAERAARLHSKASVLLTEDEEKAVLHVAKVYAQFSNPLSFIDGGPVST